MPGLPGWYPGGACGPAVPVVKVVTPACVTLENVNVTGVVPVVVSTGVTETLVPTGVLETPGASVVLIGSLIVGIVMVVRGSAGAAVVEAVVLSARVCVKLDPDGVLARLLKPALSVNVIVPLGVPFAGAV